MKKFFNLFIITLVLFTTFSCKKDEPLRPNNNNVTITEEGATLFDVSWVVYDAKFYTENMDNGDKTYYDHFSSTQSLSTFDPFSGPDVPFDTIIKDYTTWYVGSSQFVLNGSRSYDYTGSGDENISVIGLENGSSRPIEILYLGTETLTVKVHEGYGSYSGNNYEYFSVVTFLKQGSQCYDCDFGILYGYSYGGVITTTPDTNSTLAGTKWVVTRYDEGLTPYEPNDTISFGNSTYDINSDGINRNYTLSNIFGNNMSDLTMYSFNTLGGDYSGYVPDNFIEVGEINSSEFNDIFNTNNSKKVWMIRIE